MTAVYVLLILSAGASLGVLTAALCCAASKAADRNLYDWHSDLGDEDDAP